MIITENCIINGMPESLYHSDPTPVLDGFAQSASLSSSMAKVLAEKTEEEAFLSNQRLNPKWKEGKDSEASDIGTIAHDYILRGGQNVFEVAPFADWRTNASKEAKADIQARGLIALNESTAPKIKDTVQSMRDALMKQMAAHRDYPGLMMKGIGEQSAFVFDGKIWNRARFDWLDDNYPDVLVDYKTTGLSFDSWEKNQLWGEDGANYIQAAHYRRVWRALKGKDAVFVNVVQRTVEPYHVAIYTIDPAVLDDIDHRYEQARLRFINCLKTGIWRGVPLYTRWSVPPTWIMNRWEDQKLTEEMIQDREKPKQEEDKPETYMAG